MFALGRTLPRERKTSRAYNSYMGWHGRLNSTRVPDTGHVFCIGHLPSAKEARVLDWRSNLKSTTYLTMLSR
jgi:hypothetical protein